MSSWPQSGEERFLVVAPTGRDGPLTCTLLEKTGLSCAVCPSLAELCRRYREEGAAALMIAEEVFGTTGLAMLRELLETQSSWSDIPVLVFTGTPASLSARPSMAQLLSTLGNVTLLDRPLRPVTMVSAANSALRARRRQYSARSELLAQQRAVRERDQFLAMLGHELRNPLSAITMAINLEGESGRSKYREIMRRQLGHLTHLVDDLLDVSRVTSGKVLLRRENVDLAALAQRCVATIAPAFAKHRFSLHAGDEAHPRWVHADPVRLEQIVNNLLNNAAKYTPPGGQIDVVLDRSGDDVLLEVRDTGVGIAPEMIGRVFDLFTQVEGSIDRAKGGLGIGLTLVRSLVELHGGSVEARSPGLGRGSVFSIRLPALSAPAELLADSGVRPTRGSEDSGTIAVAKYDVLVVEDNADSRELLCAALARRGHTVVGAEDGPSGVELALAQMPKVLLVDIGLPGLDGYEVARRVRAVRGSSVFMIAITGYGQPEDRRRALAAGFDVHMTKPLDIGAIAKLLCQPGLQSAAHHAS
ncbi:MAG: histidine kinase [Myxococcaceae bacterium]|nr:histidine kinase [Myxococcaceae bacterium]